MYKELTPLTTKDIVIFKSPIECKYNLVRIGDKKSLIDAILFAVHPQSEYGKKDENFKKLFIKNFNKEICHIEKCESDILTLLYNFYEFMDKVESKVKDSGLNEDEELKKISKNIILDLIGESEEKLFEFELVCEIVDFQSLSDIISKSIEEAENVQSIKKYIIVSANELFESIDILKEITDDKKEYLKKLFNNLLNSILDNIRIESEKCKNLDSISRYLETKILFLDPKTRLPKEYDDDCVEDFENVIILLYYEELGIYENVCKLVKRNKVQYKFSKDDPVVHKFNEFKNPVLEIKDGESEGEADRKGDCEQ